MILGGLLVPELSQKDLLTWNPREDEDDEQPSRGWQAEVFGLALGGTNAEIFPANSTCRSKQIMSRHKRESTVTPYVYLEMAPQWLAGADLHTTPTLRTILL